MRTEIIFTIRSDETENVESIDVASCPVPGWWNRGNDGMSEDIEEAWWYEGDNAVCEDMEQMMGTCDSRTSGMVSTNEIAMNCTSSCRASVSHNMVDGAQGNELKVTEEEIEAAQECDANEALYVAVEENDVKNTKVAIAMGAKVIDHMLFCAVRHECNGVLKALLEAGADPNVMTEGEYGPVKNRTILAAASYVGYVFGVKNLLLSGADVNRCGTDKVTPVMLAAQNNYSKCVTLLIRAGANVNSVDIEGESALRKAANEADCDTVGLLLRAGASVNCADMYGISPLIAACQFVRLTNRNMVQPRRYVVEMLLQQGADVNARDSNNETALLCATRYNQEESWWYRVMGDGADSYADSNARDMLAQVKLLIDAGADVNEVDYQGATPLINACGHKVCRGEEMVNLLLDRGADINLRDENKCTSLMNAVWDNSYTVVTQLLCRGADVNAVNKCGRTVLDLSCRNYNSTDREISITKALLRGGAESKSLDVENNVVLRKECAAIRSLKLTLLHICRENIRHNVMRNNKGVHIDRLVVKLGLPMRLAEYVADHERFKQSV